MSSNDSVPVLPSFGQPLFWRKRVWPPVREFIAGSFAGVGLIVAGHPFDTIKVRLQSEGGYGRFKGPIDCLVTTLREERVFGLYKGALGPLIGQGFVSATQFGIYATLMPYIQQDRTKRPTLTEVVKAGCLTGTVMFIFVTPMEGVKARLQVQYSERHTGVVPKYSGTVDCYKQVWREFGLKGLYKGAVPTGITRVSFGAYVWGYEITRRYLTGDSGEKLSPLATLAAGGVAGTCFWLSNYPFDVVKNKMMASPDTVPPRYESMRACIREIWAKEGWKGFTRGLSVCLIRSLPANATTFLFLELARKALPL